MVVRALNVFRLVACVLVVASFLLFAHDQAAGASEHQLKLLSSGSPAGLTVKPASSHPGQPRRFIDGAAGKLTSPFRAVLHLRGTWGEEIYETLGALLLYGVLLGYLGRYTHGLSLREQPSGIREQAQ